MLDIGADDVSSTCNFGYVDVDAILDSKNLDSSRFNCSKKVIVVISSVELGTKLMERDTLAGDTGFSFVSRCPKV